MKSLRATGIALSLGMLIACKGIWAWDHTRQHNASDVSALLREIDVDAALIGTDAWASAVLKMSARIRSRALTDEDVQRLFVTAFPDSSSPLKMTSDWHAKYFGLLQEYYDSYPPGHPAEERALRMQPGVSVSTNTFAPGAVNEWPAGMGGFLGVRYAVPWRATFGSVVRVICLAPGGTATYGTSKGMLYLPVPPLPVGVNDVSLRLEFGKRTEGGLRLIQFAEEKLRLTVSNPVHEILAIRDLEVRQELRSRARLLWIPFPWERPNHTEAKSTRSDLYSLSVSIDRERLQTMTGGDVEYCLEFQVIDATGAIRLRAFQWFGPGGSKTWNAEQLEVCEEESMVGWKLRVLPQPFLIQWVSEARRLLNLDGVEGNRSWLDPLRVEVWMGDPIEVPLEVASVP